MKTKLTAQLITKLPIKLEVLIILLVLTFSYACNKPYDGGFKPGPVTCSKDNTVGFPADALDRLYFKDSTYWIYRDSISKLTDSVWVTDSKLITSNNFFNHQIYKRCFQGFYYTLNSSNTGRTTVQGAPNFIDDTTKFENIYFNVDYSIGTINYTTIFRYWIKGDKYLENQEGGNFDTLSNLIGINKNYTNILCLKNPKSNIDIYSEAYYAPYVGLIKYKTKAGRVWELLRYKIIK